MEKISLIIPVYNGEKFIKDCLESAIKQDYPNLEIIVINDASTDGTARIINEMADSYGNIRIYHKSTNEGVGPARNIGVVLAQGEYVSFLDSDDWLEPDHISSLYDLLMRTGADIAISNYNRYDNDNRQYLMSVFEKDYYEKVYSPQEWFDFQYSTLKWSTNFIVPWGKLYKKSVVDGIVFPTRVFGEDDYTTWKYYVKSDKLAYMHKASLFYRFTSESMSQSVDDNMVINLEPVLERIHTLTLMGWDVSDEVRAFRLRAADAQKASLARGDMESYRDISFQLKMMEKYKK